MNFLHLRKRSRLPIGGLVTAAIFFVILAFVQYFTPNFLASAVARVALPLLSARAAFYEAWSSENAPQAEIEQLRSENESLRALTQANISAKDTTTDTEHRFIAPVLARPRWSVYDTLFLGAGETQGVAVGMHIFAFGFVVGEIAEAYAYSSLATLYSTPGKVVPAQISGTMPVELVGTGGGSFEASVAEGAPVRAGDGAFAPGLSPHLFAIVEAVEEGNEGVLKVHLRLPVNIFELRAVEIIANDL